jgi:RNA polymerase sigma-70 factor, ECF subfamily
MTAFETGALSPLDPTYTVTGLVPVTPDQEVEARRLMIDAQRGDALAYAQLLTTLLPLARRYARSRVGDHACVEDAAQEALLSLHRARHTYDPTRPFAPWFYAIVSSRFVDVIRRERRIESREHVPDILPEPAPDSVADRGDVDFDRVRAALSALPARQREVIAALKLEDQSVREIGARLGMSESAVKVTAHRGYKALRRMLGGRDQ